MSNTIVRWMLVLAALGWTACSKDETQNEPDYVQPGASEGDEVPPTDQTPPAQTPPESQMPLDEPAEPMPPSEGGVTPPPTAPDPTDPPQQR